MISLELVVFLNCICIGILTSFVSDLVSPVKKILKNNMLIRFAIDFSVFLLGVVCVFVVLSDLYNNSFKLFEILGFVLGVILEKMSLSKMIAKTFDMIYNYCASIRNKLSKVKLLRKIAR